MSGYWPMLSDEVEVVVRGRVTARYSSTGRFDVDDLHSIHPDHVVSVEKVEPPKPPLPTTPGSVIRSSGGALHFYLGGVDGIWYDKCGNYSNPCAADSFEVILDAGASS